MKVKIIGGYHAGIVVDLPDYYDVGNVWRMQEEPSELPARMPTGVASETIREHDYTIESWYNGNGIKYLVLVAPSIDVFTEMLNQYKGRK